MNETTSQTAAGSHPAPELRVSVDAGVLMLEIDAPPVNTLSNEMLQQLRDAVRRVRDDITVRVVVIASAGTRAFASGANLREFQDMLGDAGAIEHHTGLTRETFTALAELPQPTIAAVQAAAVGGGLELALCCDFIVAGTGARLGVPEVTLGLMPGAGGTQRLPARIGHGRAMALALTGELLTAERGEAVGLVDQIAPAGQTREHAIALAGRIAALPAVAVQAIKASVRASALRDDAAGLDFEHERFLEVLATDDAREGVAAFLERRAPVFNHR